MGRMEPMAESDWHDWTQMRNGLPWKVGKLTPHPGMWILSWTIWVG